jgi:hypothetical protein
MCEGCNSLKLLVRHLEDQGVLPKGSFREALEKYLASVPPAQLDDTMHEPVRLLTKALSKPAPGSGTPWGSPWCSPWGTRTVPESRSEGLSKPDADREA